MKPVYIILAGLLLLAPAFGQTKGKAKATGPAVKHAPIPRAANGKPDLSGVWQSGGVSINGEADAPPLHPLPPIDNHPIRREPLVYKPAWEAKRKPLDPALDDPTLYCLLPGVPRIFHDADASRDRANSEADRHPA